MIYLNNAATSYPKPSCVKEAVQACLEDVPASQFRGGMQIGKRILKKPAESVWAGFWVFLSIPGYIYFRCHRSPEYSAGRITAGWGDSGYSDRA